MFSGGAETPKSEAGSRAPAGVAYVRYPEGGLPLALTSFIGREHEVGEVARLIERGEMKPAGLREVERARADGRWDAAYDAPSTAQVPDDLLRELEKNRPAREFFEMLDGRNRYAILYQIQDAKRPETRARRIEKYVAMLSEGKKIY